jgi:gamma-glutamylcyclotransferase (GGCT)/AIG2-like uncharacterized protein YtfP
VSDAIDDFGPEQRLAVYGSLRPGQRNAHVLDRIAGAWSEGYVRGTLQPINAGYAKGYLGLTLSEQGGRVPVALLSSRDLPGFWAELDAFEGEAFVRTIAWVHVGARRVEASLYEWRPTHAK